MKRQVEVFAWGLVLAAALFAAPIAAEVRRCCTDEDSIGATAVPEDDSVTAAKMADDDFGNWSCAAGVCTLDDDVVAVADIANGDWGFFTVTTNAATIDDGTVAAADLASADFGDFTVAAGVATIDNGTITTQKVLNDTLTADDINLWAPVLLDLCPPGASAVSNTCVTLTDQGAGPTSFGAGTTMQWTTTAYSQFRLFVLMGATGATNTDVILRCDTALNMGSTPTTMVTITQASLGANTLGSSAWTAFSADECFGTDVYFNIAATGGDGSEDPVVRRAYVAFQ